MTVLGRYHSLEILRILEHGAYLGSELGDILLPQKYLLSEHKVGDFIEVFIHKDSEDRLIAATIKPKGIVGEYAVLECKDSSEVGAFMDWGLEKDLMVPHAEQHRRMRIGEKYVVRICVDPRTERIFGTTRIAAFLKTDQRTMLQPGQEVDFMIYEITDLGYMGLINESYRGIIYKNQVFKPLSVGDIFKAYIKKIREDDKIDLSLDKFGYKKVLDAKDIVWEILEQHGGQMPYTDKSSPDEIKQIFQMSKGVFKNALGALYKEKKVKLEPNKVIALH